MEQNWFFEKKSMPGVVDVVVVEETLDELEIQRIRNAESEKSAFAAEQRDILFGTHCSSGVSLLHVSQFHEAVQAYTQTLILLVCKKTVVSRGGAHL